MWVLLIGKNQMSESGLDIKMAIEGKGRQASFSVVHSPKNLDFGIMQLGLILTALYIVNPSKILDFGTLQVGVILTAFYNLSFPRPHPPFTLPYSSPWNNGD